jgi:hypothetical protein
VTCWRPLRDRLSGRLEENELRPTVVRGHSANLWESGDRPEVESLVHPDGCRVVFVREVVSDRGPRPDPFQSRPGEGRTDSSPAEPWSDHHAPEIVARRGAAFGIRVEMRLGHADDLPLPDSHQYDSVAPGGGHLAGPACSVAGITDRIHMPQVIQGGFTNLHGQSVLGEPNRSFVPARKPIPCRAYWGDGPGRNQAWFRTLGTWAWGRRLACPTA